jgi:hypothetical protein
MHYCRSQWSRGRRRRSTAARLLRSWPGFKSYRGHGCLSVVCVVFCQVEVPALSWSLVQRSPTHCGAPLCVITKPRGRGGHSPRWAAEPEKIIIIINSALLENPLIISTVNYLYINFLPDILIANIRIQSISENSQYQSPKCKVVNTT